MARPSTLSAPSKELVLTALRKHKGPMTAYGLLEVLGKAGIKSPPIVYRALEALMKTGAVHKITALNAFVACNCTADHSHDLSVLTVCHRCHLVEELHNHEVIHHLTKLRKMNVNIPHAAVVELPVTCAVCA